MGRHHLSANQVWIDFLIQINDATVAAKAIKAEIAASKLVAFPIITLAGITMMIETGCTIIL